VVWLRAALLGFEGPDAVEGGADGRLVEGRLAHRGEPVPHGADGSDDAVGGNGDEAVETLNGDVEQSS